MALAPADVVVPALDDVPGVDAALAATVREQAAALGAPHGRHRLVDVAVDGLLDALREVPVRLSTMGRGLDDDPARSSRRLPPGGTERNAPRRLKPGPRAPASVQR